MFPAIGYNPGMSSELKRTRSRTILKRVLLVLLWVGLAWTAWNLKDSPSLVSNQHLAISFVLFACFLVSPIIAIGTLFGRGRLGAIIGLASLVGLIACISFVMSYFNVGP